MFYKNQFYESISAILSPHTDKNGKQFIRVQLIYNSIKVYASTANKVRTDQFNGDKITDLENNRVFKPVPSHQRNVHQMLDQVIAWANALKLLRTEEAIDTSLYASSQ